MAETHCARLWFVCGIFGCLGGAATELLTVNRIDRATRPTVSAADCGGFDTGATRGPGAAAFWCRRVLDGLVAKKEENGLLGLSYGILTWDSWSERMSNTYRIPTYLFDCYEKVESKPSEAILHYRSPSERHEICVDGKTYTKDGRRFEAFSQRLASLPNRRLVVKMDVEGSEWAALSSASDEQLQSIDLLDLEIHFCEPPCPRLPQAADVLERLLKLFAVTGRATGGDLPFDVNVTDDELCHPRPQGQVYPSMACISYVNKARLEEVMPKIARPPGLRSAPPATSQRPQAVGRLLTANRIDRATRPTVSAGECGGFDTKATRGPGAAAFWCRRVLDRLVARKAENGLIGISYGIFTWDSWSKRLSNAYGIPTELYDCYAEVGSKPAKAILHYRSPSNRHDVCVDGKTYMKAGRRFEAFSEHMKALGNRSMVVKMDVEGSEWAALSSASDEQLQNIDLLDLEIHFCMGPSPMLPETADVLERLLRVFAVTGRATTDDLPFDVNITDKELCHPRPHGQVYPSMACISYVNKARLAEVASKSAWPPGPFPAGLISLSSMATVSAIIFSCGCAGLLWRRSRPDTGAPATDPHIIGRALE